MVDSVSALASFYRGKRVLVTGHTGFKGAWLALWLLEMGCEVTGFSLAPQEPSLFGLLDLQSRLRSVTGDIRNKAALEKTFAAAKPELVFHLAAQSLVIPSYDEPLETFATNIMGTLNVLECARRAGSVKAIVNITTDKCYENDESAKSFRETDKLGGDDPYSSSKAAAEIVSHAYRKSFLAREGIAMATARAGNIIGGGDFAAHRLIPDIVRAALSNEAVGVRNPASIRPWQYVLDALHGYLLLGQRLSEKGKEFAEAFNFGPDEADVPALALAQQFAKAMQAPAPEVTPQEGAVHEARTLKLDNAKAKKNLLWRPRLATKAAIEWSAKWYYEYKVRKDSIATFTRDQLATYSREIAS